MRISIVMLDRIVPGLHSLINALHTDFAAEVSIDLQSLHFSRAYDKKRKQWNAETLINELAPFRSPLRKTLYLFNEDIFIPSLTFVFGLTYNDVCIVSTKRLDPRFYGKVRDLGEARKIFKKRLATEIVHELGHSFKLQHCSNKKCVMNYSHSIQGVDSKNPVFCKQCTKKLHPAF